ncbi:MAG: SDR family NAD(P)-dependent oxidoreductase [Lentimicrobium sp.]|nr:SDR family NAD(P)-dependent oxidoreductase [Lentimicrobium sp.]
MVHTLITGGSMGFGRSLAFECARRGMNLLLVALPGKELENTASRISSEFQVDVRYLPIDLTELDGPKNLYNWCCDQNLKINCIINDAGLAGATLFAESPVEYSDARILLNIRALTLICRFFIPILKQHPKAWILNVGSMAAYFPIPYKSVYSATKAYVLNFSKSLAVELRPSGIQVSVVCPNGIETNPGTIARNRAHKNWGKWTKMDCDKLAAFTIEKMLQGKRVIVPLFINKFLLAFRKLFPPPLLMWTLEREFRAEPRSD